MFFSSVHADDDLKRYPAAIQKAIEYAKNTDFSALEDGRQEIDGDKMYANLFHLTSKQKEEAHPELTRNMWTCSIGSAARSFAALRRTTAWASASRRARMTTCISMTT